MPIGSPPIYSILYQNINAEVKKQRKMPSLLSADAGLYIDAAITMKATEWEVGISSDSQPCATLY